MKSDENNLDDEFRQFAFNLKVVKQDEKNTMSTELIINEIAYKLSRKHMNEQFLFIFDNCHSIKNTKEYLNLIMKDKNLKNIKFLITTTIGSPIDEFDSDTRGKIRNFTETVMIEPFKQNETIKFIKSNL